MNAENTDKTDRTDKTGGVAVKEEIKVSVICTVYNHEKFLRRCLDGFLMQKTDFAYEILIHDDASGDQSAEIIQEYAQKYPAIIKPVIQQENQYSKGINPTQDIILPICRGKYIALCEGDDYWSCSEKLQRQYDFMEQHDDCSMCVHNTVIHDLQGKVKDRNFFESDEITKLTEHQVFFGWGVHTSSYFIRKEYAVRAEYAKKYFFGDYIYLVDAYTHGTIYSLPQVMSVYNINNEAGMTYGMLVQSQKGNAEKVLQRKAYLLEFNKATEGKYAEIVHKRIREIEFSANKIEVDFCIKKAEDRRKLMSQVKALTEESYYQVFLCGLSQKQRLYSKIKYEGYKIWPLWWLLICMKKDRKLF